MTRAPRSAVLAAGLVALAGCAPTPPPRIDAPPTVARRAWEPRVLAPVLDDAAPPADADGYDGSRITIDGAVDARAWLPLLDGGRRSVPFVRVTARAPDGAEVAFPALLDTGAQITLLPRAVADALGAAPVLDDTGAPVVRGVVDALGATSRAAIVEIASLALGPVVFERVRAAVPEGDPVSWPVVGFPELAQVDLVFAVDSGVVGVFPAGAGPRLSPPARALDVAVRDDALHAEALVPQTAVGRDAGRVPLVVDTGASSTTLPAALGLARDARLTERVRVLGGRGAVTRARAPVLHVGDVALALAAVDVTPAPVGLLGGDALLAHRALVSASRALVELAPARWGPPTRATWRGRACATQGPGPCIEARLVRCPPSRGALDETCVEVAVDPSIRVALAIDVWLFDDGAPGGAARLLRPRAMTAVFPAGAARTDGLALPTLVARPTRLAIRVRRLAPEEEDCRPRTVCWWS